MPSSSSVLPSRDYAILVKQTFRCAANVPDYECPLGSFRTFDRAGYCIVAEKAYCPSCARVLQQDLRAAAAAAARPSTDIIIAKQRILHFLHRMQWTVGNGAYTLSFADFWRAFYAWAEEERLYTKKSVVRKILTTMCGIRYDAVHLPITPVGSE